MGACNCREEERVEYGNLYTSENTLYKNKSLKKTASSGSIKRAKQSANPENKRVNVIELYEHQETFQPEEAKSVKMIEYQTKEQELPFSVYNSVEKEDSIKIENNLQPANEEEIKEISNKLDSSISIKEDSVRDDDSVVLTFDQEYEYDEFSNHAFNFFNSLRTTPEKFVNSYDQSN
jgi:hypothetical protein